MSAAIPNKRNDCDRLRRGLSQYFHGRHVEALADLSALRGQDTPTGRMARYYRALAHRALGLEAMRLDRHERAQQHFAAAMREVGQSAGVMITLAAASAREGQFDQCAARTDRALTEAPDNGRLWRRLAQAQWRAGRRDEARLTLQQALRRCGGLAELHLQAGLFHAADGRVEQARESLARAAVADRSLPEAQYYLGLAEMAAGDFPAAARSLQRALELRPHDLLIAWQLASAAKEASRAGCPIVLRPACTHAVQAPGRTKALARYIADNPEFIDALLTGPQDHELLTLMLAALRSAIEQCGDWPDLRLASSRLLDHLGRTEEALSEARRALARNPRYAAALVQTGELCRRLGRFDESAEAFTRAIACGADWPDLHCRAADALARCRRRNDARRHLNRALHLKPDYRPAAEALRKLAA